MTLIAIDGGIAAGKTTLARALAALHGFQAVMENYAGIKSLEDFYRTPSRHAAETEYAFIRMHAGLISALSADAPNSLLDFSLERDLAYGRVTLADAPQIRSEWEREWRQLRAQTRRPDCTIRLHCPHEVQLCGSEGERAPTRRRSRPITLLD